MLLEIDGTLIALVASFIVFMVIMHNVFYVPMTEVREERQKYVKKNLEEAEKARKGCDSLLKDRNEKITQTRTEANKIVLEATLKANKEKEKILEQTASLVNEKINLSTLFSIQILIRSIVAFRLIVVVSSGFRLHAGTPTIEAR